MLAESVLARVAPVAGIGIVHELADGIELAAHCLCEWTGTAENEPPIVIRHEVGDARPTGMTPVLEVPPWCTFHLDGDREPASLFHAVFGEVDRLLVCEEPGTRYVVRYAPRPRDPVIALQSELTTYSFALAARGSGLIAHSCAFVLPSGRGVLCPGMSGAGKTTLAKLLARQAPDVEVLTDDRAIVAFDEHLTIWGSPWPGAAQIASGESALFAILMFIRHGSGYAIRSVSAGEAFRRVINALSMPLWEPARVGRALEIVDAMVTRAPIVEVTYTPTDDVARHLVADLERLSG